MLLVFLSYTNRYRDRYRDRRSGSGDGGAKSVSLRAAPGGLKFSPRAQDGKSVSIELEIDSDSDTDPDLPAEARSGSALRESPKKAIAIPIAKGYTTTGLLGKIPEGESDALGLLSYTNRYRAAPEAPFRGSRNSGPSRAPIDRLRAVTAPRP